MKESSVSLIDSFFQFGNPVEEKFYSIGSFRDEFDIKAGTKEYFHLVLYQDSNSDQYERRVYSIMDVIGQLGGFFEVLIIFGGFLVNSFSVRIFYYSLFNKLYHISDKNKKESPKISRKETWIFPKSSIELKKKGHESSQSIDKINALQNDKKQIDKENEMKEYIREIEDRLSSTQRYDYSIKDYLKTSIPFVQSKSK